MSKYLVTGGCSYIGYHLVNQLQLEGHTVKVLDSKITTRCDCWDSDYEVVEGDMNDLEVLERAFEGIDGCFHLASSDRLPSNSNGSHIGNMENAGSFNVFNAACSVNRRKPVPIVYASTRDVYGDNADLTLSENASTRPLTVGAVEKLSAEYYARVVSLNHDLPTTGLRLFDVYGPKAGCHAVESNLVERLVEKVACGKPIHISGNSIQTFDLVYIDDVCQFFTEAMNKMEHNASIFNVCSGKSVGLLDLVNTIATLSNMTAKICIKNSSSKHIHTSIGNPEQAAIKLGARAITNLSNGLRETISSVSNQHNQGGFEVYDQFSVNKMNANQH